MKLITTIITLVFLSANYTFAADYLPSSVIQLDSQFTHHVIVVEKSTHKLMVYENNKGNPKLLKEYKIATGKIKGNKQIQGDKKTPEGIYTFRKFHSSEDLIGMYGKTGLIYGAGAFTMNYPNVIDVRKGKTGGGIWLHSTDDDSRVSKGLDSRGCVVAIDADLKDISQYIDLGKTPIVVVQDHAYLSKESWNKIKTEVNDLIGRWVSAWQSKDFKNYIESYSKEEFFSATKGGYHSFKAYKRRIFARPDKPQINISNVSILFNGEYIVAKMRQDYSSPFIKDTGKKTLYIKRNSNYEWKIISEDFEALAEETPNLAFTPSMKYFTKDSESKEVENDTGSI